MDAERRQLVVRARRMVSDRLAVGTSGNVSVRTGDLVAITPSGIEPDALRPADVCIVDLDGRRVDGERRPSSELPMHLAIYHAGPAGAVVHTHPPFATAVACVADELPPVHYLVALFGGTVPVVPYAPFGSDELAAAAASALHGRSAVLLGNHGATTTGVDLGAAYERALQLEWVCQVWLHARRSGEPRLLDRGEVERVAGRLATYGQPPG